jgi:cytochrome c-type biogenesis protein CcmH/NrfG
VKKENILYIVVALLIGLLGGYLVFSLASGKKQADTPTSSIPMGAGSPADYQARITEAEKVVAKEPKNLQAWVSLGNDYFDTSQPQKAIDAYSKALEINPNNPDVLTDQGVMFKKVGWFDKALANFEKAQQIDPKHLQSLYNIGVVYMEDLKQRDKALVAWGKYLEMDSTSPTAQQIKAVMEKNR